jgi:amino acid transporter
MLGVQRAAELATAMFHIGGLSGAAVMLAEKQTWAALWLALVATACVLLLNGALVLAEIGRVKVRQYVRKHEERSLKLTDKKYPNA